MTCQRDFTLSEEILSSISQNGLEALPEAMTVILNAAMQFERQKYLGAQPYERTPDRQDYANGYKSKTVLTRSGLLTLDIPQVRSSEFYPSALEKGTRSEKALNLTIAEMYVQGVSTRKVASICEKLCGTGVSSTQVSHLSQQLDATFESWRTRPIGEMRYLYFDAMYEKVRMGGKVDTAAVLIASGVGTDGKRQILGVSVSLSEHESHWRAFFKSLVARGLTGIHLITSDAHSGLQAARQAVFGGVPWQRCQFHLQQNAQAYVPRQEMRTEVARDIRCIYNSRDLSEANEQLRKCIDKYAKPVPKLADWMEKNIPEGLTVFAFPEAHRRLLRTSNSLERLNKEVRRRTRVVGLFPNEAACLRLISGVLMEISEDWETGKVYLTL